MCLARVHEGLGSGEQVSLEYLDVSFFRVFSDYFFSVRLVSTTPSPGYLCWLRPLSPS